MAARIIQPADDEWEDTGDIWEDVELPETEPVSESETPSLLSRAWSALNKPLVDLAPIAKKASDWITTPELDDFGITSRVKGFTGGAIEGLGDVISGFTSPIELGMAATTGGSSIAAKRGFGTAAKGLSAIGAGLSGLESAHGGYETLRPDATLAERGLGLAELAGGLAGGLENVKALRTKLPEVTPSTAVKPIETPTSKVEPDTDWLDVPEPEQATLPIEAEPKQTTIPLETPKPKIKVKINTETNSLEPDLSDELTAKVINSAKTGEPIPDGQRLNPDDEIDFEEAWQLFDARQPELGLENPEALKATHRAGNLTRINQKELPGNLREKAEPTVPGGKPVKERPITPAQEWLGIPRAIQSAFDLSFPLRQGLGLIHTKGWWKAWPDMIKSFGSEETYKGVMDSIANRPNFKGRIIRNPNGSPRLNVKTNQPLIEQSLAQKAGLAITDLVSNREEELGSKIAGSIPGFGKGLKASNRAYNAFANKLRADAFDSLIAQNPSAKTDLVLAKELANFVNNASGRGNLGKWEGSATALNNLLFSPRLMASRLQMLNPRNYVFTRPEVRKEYLKSTMAMAGTWLSLAGLAKAGGAEVVMDPESTDFGKIKIGNTRLDPAGGFQQYIVLASRLAKGGLDKARQTADRRYSGKAFAPTPENDVLNFIENKIAPNARFIAGPWLANKTQQFELGDQALRTFTPIMLQDLSEIMQEDPELAWTLLPGLVGVGSNTYQPGKKSPTLLPPSLWNRKKDITFQ